MQQKLSTTQTNLFKAVQVQPQSVGKTVKIVRLNPSVASGSQSQALSAAIVPSPLKKGIVSIAPTILKSSDNSEATSIIPSTTSLEEIDEESSGPINDAKSKEDPKEALKRRLREIEEMNEELRRKKEEADNLQKQLEETAT